MNADRSDEAREPETGVEGDATESPATGDLVASVAASRRRFQRLALNATVEVYEAKDARCVGEPFSGTLKDIGRGGVCLRCRRALMKDQLIFIRMPLGGNRWKLLFGEVRHARYADTGMYEMGVQFTPIPTQQVYQQWIESLTRKFGGGDC